MSLQAMNPPFQVNTPEEVMEGDILLDETGKVFERRDARFGGTTGFDWRACAGSVGTSYGAYRENMVAFPVTILARRA